MDAVAAFDGRPQDVREARGGARTREESSAELCTPTGVVSGGRAGSPLLTTAVARSPCRTAAPRVLAPQYRTVYSWYRDETGWAWEPSPRRREAARGGSDGAATKTCPVWKHI